MPASSPYGEPQVMEFKDGKLGAFSMQFDDSMETQAEFAIPEMNRRGLVGTFFVNPGTGRYQRTRETWEVVCPKFGHELANHTMRHEGAEDYAEADHEIGECARLIWKLYPNESKLRPFLRGGGTTWGTSREEMRELMDKYYLFRAPRRTGLSDERGTGQDPSVFARQAVEEREWVLVGFHGVGGQWISVCEEGFIKLLDYLVANRDRLWTATTGDIYRYREEYGALSGVPLTDATETGFKVALECDESKVKTYGRPLTELYDEPLTVRVRVPKSWTRFRLTQGDRTEEREVIEVEGEPCAQFDARPNVGPASVAILE